MMMSMFTPLLQLIKKQTTLKGLVRYCDSLYILVLPVGSETGNALSSNRDALGSSPT